MGEVRGGDQVQVVGTLGNELLKMARRRSGGMGLPKSWWLIWSFWQNTQSSVQPEKNTVPAPRVPERQGSSQW